MKGCEGCVNYRPMHRAGGAQKMCHFMLYTGQKRGCPPENCTRRITERDWKRQHTAK